MPEALACGNSTHDPPVDRIVLGHYDRRRMRPGLEQATLVPQQRLQVPWLVRPDAAEDDELVTRRDHAGRIELQEAWISGNVEEATGGRVAALTCQSLASDRQPPCGLGRDSA